MPSAGEWPRARSAAYMLDGVLCEAPPPSWNSYTAMRRAERLARRQELLTHYRNAMPVWDPGEPMFHVFTTRRDDAAVRQATALWLARHFPRRVRAVTYIPFAPSVSAAALLRAAALARCGAREYTEAAPGILTRLVPAAPGVRLWYFDGEQRRPGLQNP